MSEEEKEIYMKICKYDEEPKKVILDLLQDLQLKDKVIDVLAEKLEEKSRWMTKLKWKEFAYNEIKLKENKNV